MRQGGRAELHRNEAWREEKNAMRKLVRLFERAVRTETGEWTETLFRADRMDCSSLVFGHPDPVKPVACRVHSFCYSGHALLSTECDCVDQMRSAQQWISKAGSGVIVVLDQSGRGFGHLAMMKAVSLSRAEGISQSQAYTRLHGSSDRRRYDAAVLILKALGIRSVELMTNNPAKVEALASGGIEVCAIKRTTVEDLANRPELVEMYADKKSIGHTV